MGNQIRQTGTNRLTNHHLQIDQAGDTSTAISDIDFSPQFLSDDNFKSLTTLAEQAMHEFLLKAIGNSAVDWVSIPQIQLDPKLDGSVYVSHSCVGVAARVDTIIPLDPIEIMNILKQYSSWYRDCRKAEVVGSFPTANGGIIELIYMQVYGPTTLATARDFWILRLTLTLNDGKLVVCNTSIPTSFGSPSLPQSTGFKRAKMLPSGYVLHQCRLCSEGARLSKLTIVDHLDLEFKEPSLSQMPGSLEVLRPLYESSGVLAQRMTLAALYHVHHMAKEKQGKLNFPNGLSPAVLRSFSHRLSRGYNEAVNGFAQDGWFLMNYEPSKDIVLSIKQVEELSGKRRYNYVLGVKASVLLLDVFPPTLLQVLRKHRAEWSDFHYEGSNVNVTASKPDLLKFPGFTSTHLEKGVSVGPTTNQDEAFELFRYEDRCPQDNPFLGTQYLAQISSGLDEGRFAGCSELIFAPFNRTLRDDAMPLSSGFRITTLSPDSEITSKAKYTTNIAGALARYPVIGSASSSDDDRRYSLMLISFQFSIPPAHQDFITGIARQYVRHVMSVVQAIAYAIADPSAHLKTMNGPTFMIAKRMCECYRLYFGRELLAQDLKASNSFLQHLWYHKDAILCCTVEHNPVCFFANQAGLNMLEISRFDRQGMPLQSILGNSESSAGISTLLPTTTEKGFVILSKGICFSAMQKFVSYEQLVAWNVSGGEGDRNYLALALINWKFIS